MRHERVTVSPLVGFPPGRRLGRAFDPHRRGLFPGVCLMLSFIAHHWFAAGLVVRLRDVSPSRIAPTEFVAALRPARRLAANLETIVQAHRSSLVPTSECSSSSSVMLLFKHERISKCGNGLSGVGGCRVARM